MKIKKLNLRHYPAGIQIEFIDGTQESIEISRDVLDYLNYDTLYTSAEKIINTNPSLQARTDARQEKHQHLLVKLLTKLLNVKKYHFDQTNEKKFKLSRVLKSHVLPLTNVAFNKSGSLLLTGSYDRTAKIWPVIESYEKGSNFENSYENSTGDKEPLVTLEGHTNVVYCLDFNNPFGDRVATGSFDKTAKIWKTETGQCVQTLRGHQGEVVCLGFNSARNPENRVLATGSMDSRAALWKIEDGLDLSQPTHWLAGHSADVIALDWEPHETGSKLITGSFDRTAAVWDVNSKNGTGSSGKGVISPLFQLIGHREELSAVYMDYTGSMAITGSMDHTARIWDLRNGKCVSCLRGHTDEVLDVAFSNDRFYAATGGADSKACLYDLRKLSIDQPELYGETVSTNQAESFLEGHQSEISQVKFNPAGTHLLTVSADSTARIYRTDTGECTQELRGHEDEIFSCAFNYHGDVVVTGSKDNTCRIWTIGK